MVEQFSKLKACRVCEGLIDTIASSYLTHVLDQGVMPLNTYGHTNGGWQCVYKMPNKQTNKTLKVILRQQIVYIFLNETDYQLC